MCLECSGVTTENLQSVYSFWLDLMIPFYWLPWLLFFCQLLSTLNGKSAKLAVSTNFSGGFTVPVVFHSDGWSTKFVIVFVVFGGIVRASSVTTGWGFVVVSFEAVIACIVKRGKCMRPCVVSVTTLVIVKKSNPIIGPVNIFITTKFSAKISSPF